MFSQEITILFMSLCLKDLIFCILSKVTIGIVITSVLFVILLSKILYYEGSLAVRRYIQSQWFQTMIVLTFCLFNSISFGNTYFWQSHYLIALYNQRNSFIQTSSILVFQQLFTEIFEYNGYISQLYGFQLSSLIIILLFEIYFLLKCTHIQHLAKELIVQDVMSKTFIKIYNTKMEDLTPDIFQQDQKLDNVIFTARNKKEVTELLSTQKNQINFKSYNQSEQIIGSFESLVENQNKYEKYNDIKRLIEAQLAQQISNEFSLIIASQLDLQTGKKNKYKVHINFEIKNYYIVSFTKLDSALLKKQIDTITKFKTRLANSFTHKLKTSLNTTLGYLQNALNDRNISYETIKSYIQPSFVHSKMQLYQVQDLLDFLNTSEELVLQLSKFNLTSSLTQVYAFIEYQCKVKNININFTINGDDWRNQENQFFLYTDCQKFERILLNLLNNSYRFAPLNGELKLEINLDQVLNKLYIKINDNGSGFTDEQLELINNQAEIQNKFKFSNHSISLNQKQKFGLTLQITNKLIYLLSSSNCSLKVNKLNRNGGCSFEFFINISTQNSEIPLESFKYSNYIKQNRQSSIRFLNQLNRSNHSSQKSVHSNQQDELIEDEPQAVKPKLSKTIAFQETRVNTIIQQRPTLCGLRDLYFSHAAYDQQLISTPKHQDTRSILIVDDEPFNHSTLTLMLQKLGHKHFLYSFNGQDCIDIVSHNQSKIKTIFMDLDMPIMGGIQSTQILIKMMTEGQIEYIPIIGCTAHDDYDTQIKCLKAGMVHVVTKPVFIRSLMEAYHQIKELQQEHKSNLSNSFEKQ